MKVAKIKIVVEIETELNPEWYSGCFTDEERLSVCIKGVNEDPFLIMDSKDAKWEITGEISK